MDVNTFEREAIYRLEQEKQQKAQEAKDTLETIAKKEQEILKLRGQQTSMDEMLIEEKAKAALKRYGFDVQMTRLCRNTYKIIFGGGIITMAYFKLYRQEGNFEATLVAKVSVKRDKFKSVPNIKIGEEVFYNFEKLVKFYSDQ